MSEHETVIFYHLPKTAGSTMMRILRQNYSPNDMVGHGIDTHAFVADFKTWPLEKRANIRVMHGHFPFGIHELLPQPSRTFTLLRDPIERTISYFYHARRDKHHYLHALIHENGWDLKALLESEQALMMNDAQVRLLSGVWGDAPFRGVTEAMLETAVSNLRQCAVVGVTEAFDETLLLLQHTFGWPHILYSRQNVGKNRLKQAELSADTIATIKGCNQLDLRLYDEAHRLFEGQKDRSGLNFAWQTAVFQLRQRLNQSPLYKKLSRRG